MPFLLDGGKMKIGESSLTANEAGGVPPTEEDGRFAAMSDKMARLAMSGQ